MFYGYFDETEVEARLQRLFDICSQMMKKRMTDGELRMLNQAIDEIDKRNPTAAQFIIEQLKRAGGFLDDRYNKNP